MSSALEKSINNENTDKDEKNKSGQIILKRCLSQFLEGAYHMSKSYNILTVFITTLTSCRIHFFEESSEPPCWGEWHTAPLPAQHPQDCTGWAGQKVWLDAEGSQCHQYLLTWWWQHPSESEIIHAQSKIQWNSMWDVMYLHMEWIICKSSSIL